MTDVAARETQLAKALAVSRLSGIGPARFKMLASAAGTPERLVESIGSGRAAVPGLKAQEVGDLRAGALDEARAFVGRTRSSGIEMISLFEESYPSELKEAYDPPSILYVKGRLEPRDRVRVAVVGARRATPYGVRMARRIAAGLSRAGVTVVSGLALGIDAAAHEGALEAGGAAWAVLGGGLSRVYPKENRPLADRIVASGGVLLSEYEPDQDARPEFFPARNRILAGLCRAVVVVEADKKSGALITADAALAEGREVFAVPGPADSPLSSGTHGLLRQGAALATCAEDILEGLGVTASSATAPRAAKTPAPQGLSETERALAGLLANGPLSMDALLEHGAAPLPVLSETLLRLEIKGFVRALPGGVYSLTEG